MLGSHLRQAIFQCSHKIGASPVEKTHNTVDELRMCGKLYTLHEIIQLSDIAPDKYVICDLYESCTLVCLVESGICS